MQPQPIDPSLFVAPPPPPAPLPVLGVDAATVVAQQQQRQAQNLMSLPDSISSFYNLPMNNRDWKQLHASVLTPSYEIIDSMVVDSPSPPWHQLLMGEFFALLF